MKVWSLLWTTWALSLLLAITLMWGALIINPYVDPPHLYVFLGIGFFNGLVLPSLIVFPPWAGVSSGSYTNLAIAVLVGLAQWFVIRQLGRLWLLNWQDRKWYWKFLFPVVLASYYIITGLLSMYLFAIAVS